MINVKNNSLLLSI